MTRFNHSRLAAFLALGLAASLPGLGRSQTWVGPGADWNTAANWSPATVPNSATAAVNFNGTGPGNVNISGVVDVNTLTFSNPSGSYTLTSSTGQSLALVGGLSDVRRSLRPESRGRRQLTWPTSPTAA